MLFLQSNNFNDIRFLVLDHYHIEKKLYLFTEKQIGESHSRKNRGEHRNKIKKSTVPAGVGSHYLC